MNKKIVWIISLILGFENPNPKLKLKTGIYRIYKVLWVVFYASRCSLININLLLKNEIFLRMTQMSLTVKVVGVFLLYSIAMFETTNLAEIFKIFKEIDRILLKKFSIQINRKELDRHVLKNLLKTILMIPVIVGVASTNISIERLVLLAWHDFLLLSICLFTSSLCENIISRICLMENHLKKFQYHGELKSCDIRSIHRIIEMCSKIIDLMNHFFKWKFLYLFSKFPD